MWLRGSCTLAGPWGERECTGERDKQATLVQPVFHYKKVAMECEDIYLFIFSR